MACTRPPGKTRVDVPFDLENSMSRIRAGMAALAACLAFPAAAQAWRGWQAGVGLGFGDARGAIRSGSVYVSPGYSPAGGTFFAAETVPQLDAIADMRQTTRSAAPGLALAWSAQEGDLVRGWMLDAASMRLRLRSGVSQNYRAPCCTTLGFTLRQSMDTSTLVALRARAGWARGDWLWYGSAGVALTDLRVRSQFEDDSEGATAELGRGHWRAGLALGWGVERSLPGGWSWRLEWLRVDFGTAREQVNNLASPFGAYPNSPWITHARLRADRLSIGLQRRW